MGQVLYIVSVISGGRSLEIKILSKYLYLQLRGGVCFVIHIGG